MADEIEITDAMRSPIGVEPGPWTQEVTTTSRPKESGPTLDHGLPNLLDGGTETESRRNLRGRHTDGHLEHRGSLGGVVKRKWEENGERLAELELYVKNEQGRNTTPGTAVVRCL